MFILWSIQRIPEKIWFVPNLLSVIRFSWADSWHKKGQLVKGIIKMSMTDPISDMLTRVRNASQALHDRVEVPASKVKVVSTSQGVMTDRICRKSNVGGEVLCHVW